MCVRAENWRFSKMIKVKPLPVTVHVRGVDFPQPIVDLSGHKLQLLAVSEHVFLRANAINNGWSSTMFDLSSVDRVFCARLALLRIAQ